MSDSLSKQKKLVPISEAAKVLGVSIDTIRRWDKSGVLHSERPDGKNRYFSLDELEQHKLNQPLSISEVARKFSVSATTLRRLEARGLIKPKRNNAGERVYDEDLLKNFLNSDYFLRKKQIKEKFPEPFQEEKGLIDDLTLKDQTDHLERGNLASNKDRMPQFLTISALGFVVLVAFSVWNINVSAAKSQKPLPDPAVLAETQELTPPATTSEVNLADSLHTSEVSSEATAEAAIKPEAKTEITLTVKIDDGSSFVNIRQKPTINSEKIGKANNGDSFEFISEDSSWYEIRLADGETGFISKKYLVTNERNN